MISPSKAIAPLALPEGRPGAQRALWTTSVSGEGRFHFKSAGYVAPHSAGLSPVHLPLGKA